MSSTTPRVSLGGRYLKANKASQTELAFKLSRKQLRSLKRQIEEILKERDTIRQCLDLLADGVEPLDWYRAYQHPPVKLGFVLAQAMGYDLASLKSASLEQFIEALFSDKNDDDHDICLEEWDRRRPPHISREIAFGILLAYAFDLECVGRHGLHMYELLKKARLGSDKAVFDILSIDPMAKSCDVIQKRHTKAVYRRDTKFLERYSRTLLSSSSKYELHRKQMRIYFRLLKDSGELESYDNEALHELFQEFGVIPAYTDNRDNIKTLKAKTLKEWQELEI